MSRKKPLLTLAMLALLVASLALGCSAPAPSGSGSKTLTVAFTSDAITLDPHEHTDANTDQVTYQIYEPLIQIGRDGKFEPVLAESWQIVDDNTWKFTLRKGVKFHNGEDFNAEAVKFTMDRASSNTEQVRRGATFRQYIAETTVLDSYTVQIKTKTPYAPMLAILSTNGRIIPPKYYKEVGKERFAKEPNGTGAYKFGSWEKDIKVTLEANDKYWRGNPAFDKYVYRVIPESAARVAAVLKGEVDLVAAVPLERAKEVESGKDTRIATRPGQIVYMGMDSLKVPAFKDKRVRQAMNHAIDMDGIIKEVLGAQAIRLNGPLFPVQPGYDASIKPYAYDPEKAKKLMADAGFANGFEVTLTVPVGYQNMLKLKDVGESIASQLQRIGVKANIDIVESAVAEQRFNAKTLQMYIYAWGVDPPSGRNVENLLHSKSRSFYYNSAEADKLIEEYTVTVDPQKRDAIGKTMHKFLYDEAPFVFMYQEKDILGVNKRITWEPIESDNRLRAYEFKLK